MAVYEEDIYVATHKPKKPRSVIGLPGTHFPIDSQYSSGIGY